MQANEILLLYHQQFQKNAQTISEHIASFERHSKFTIRSINIENEFPAYLSSLQFPVIVLHYSLYNWGGSRHTGQEKAFFAKKFWDYIRGSTNSFKIAFFQDEMHNCNQRFYLINTLGIDFIYTLFERRFFVDTYYKFTTAKQIVPTLAGYVSDELEKLSVIWNRPRSERSIDVGYRARPLPFYMGKGAQEKTDIGRLFLELCRASNMVLDIRTDESDRIYGEAWWQFISDCKFMLGVESGTSVVDLDGSLEDAVCKFLKENPNATFDLVHSELLAPFDEVINYRMVSPRIFECAAMRTCMILFRGTYQGILIPDRHYIPLDKDFSNINEVLSKMNDDDYTDGLTTTAYQDLIISGNYSYKSFIDEFDSIVANASRITKGNKSDQVMITNVLNRDLHARRIVTIVRNQNFPGRSLIKNLAYLFGYRK